MYFFDILILSYLHPWVDVKNFFGGNLDFPKIKKYEKVCSNT